MSNKQKSGSYIWLYLSMGAISGLVRLALHNGTFTGIWLFIAQSATYCWVSALYALSLSMGIPLIYWQLQVRKLLAQSRKLVNIVKVNFWLYDVSGGPNICWTLTKLCAGYSRRYGLGQCLALPCLLTYLWMIKTTKVFLFKGLRTLLIFVGLMASGLWLFNINASICSISTNVQE